MLTDFHSFSHCIDITILSPLFHDQKYSVLPSYSHTYPSIFKLFKQHISVPRDSDLQVVIYFGPSAISFPWAEKGIKEAVESNKK